MQVKFASEDNNVAEVSGTTVIAVKEGTTILKGYVSPYGDSLPETKLSLRKIPEILRPTHRQLQTNQQLAMSR